MPRRGGISTASTAAAIAGALASLIALALALAPSGRAAVDAAAYSGPKLIAFATSSPKSPAVQVWVANVAGTHASKLGEGDAPRVAPDGAYVVSASNDGNALNVYSTSGGAPRRFVVKDAVPYPIAISPDSRYVAVGLDNNATNGGSTGGLAVIDTTTDILKVVAHGVVYGAGFAVDGSDRIVFGLSKSEQYTAPVDLYEVAPNGSGLIQMTKDGTSLYPIWGARGIAFDHERLVKSTGQEDFEVWLMGSSGAITHLTNMKIPPLLDGLVPVDVSADGNRLLADYEGTDTSNAWTIQLHPLRVREVIVGKQTVQPGAISRDGKTLLIDVGAFEDYPSYGTVETVPFASGGPVHKLARGAFPSWNQ